MWTALWIILIVVGGGAALYGLHHLCLWLERRGWLYYKHKRGRSSGLSCFVAIEKVLEPPTKHVHQVQQEKRQSAEEAPGQDEGDSPPVCGS